MFPRHCDIGQPTLILNGLRGQPLIDLHCHILPGFDDGSPDLATSLEMARIAAADGIGTIACTPHITPGVYENAGAEIFAALERFRVAVTEAGIELNLVLGADIHVAPNLIAGLRSGHLPSLNNSRYFLLEPPHHVLPPRFDEFAFALIAAGFVPVLTHPERLTWIDGHYDVIERLHGAGVLMQLTAGSLLGRFGRRPRYWAERMLDEGLAHLIATDAHDTRRRPPRLAEARDVVARRLGQREADRLTVANPLNILQNVLPSVMQNHVADRRVKTRRLWRRVQGWTRWH